MLGCSDPRLLIVTKHVERLLHRASRSGSVNIDEPCSPTLEPERLILKTPQPCIEQYRGLNDS